MNYDTKQELIDHYGEPLAEFECTEFDPIDDGMGYKKITWLIFKPKTSRKYVAWAAYNDGDQYSAWADNGYLIRAILDRMTK